MSELMTADKVKEVKYVRMVLPVRYDDEDMPYDFPQRRNKEWDIIVEAETGRILNFPTGIEYNLYMKVTDEGTYTLLDANKNVLASLHEEYVPDNYSIPGEYGDYIDFKIKNGFITNWYINRTYGEFIGSEDEC